MKKFLIFVVLALVTLAGAQVPEKKQTTLGLYLTAAEAVQKWSANTESVHLLDVRTPAEYVFVGHAPEAVNIPWLFFNGINQDATLQMNPNENFVQQVSERFSLMDTILVMCRSGGRSAKAVNKLAKAGYKNVYQIYDGFEGDKLNDPGNSKNGKRVVNGWKNCGGPWTCKLDTHFVYRPVENETSVK